MKPLRTYDELTETEKKLIFSAQDDKEKLLKEIDQRSFEAMVRPRDPFYIRK